MPYRGGRFSQPQRYLIKALREVGHQVEGLVSDLSEHALTWRPDEDEWCAKDIVGFLRDSEREDLEAVQAIIARDGARIEERRAHHGPAEHDYRSTPLEELLWEFETLREELVWTLRTAGRSWGHAGTHPYRGRVTLERYVHEISDRDLDAAWKLRRLRDRVPSSRSVR